MKSCIWTIVFLWCCNLLAIAQTKYEVTANTFLNIRSHASTDAPIVGTIDKGGEVEVYEITDGWAKIRYNDDYAYVSAQYLKKTESNAPVSISTKKWFDFSSKPLGKGNVKWMVFVIAGLSLILFFMGKAREDDKPLEEGLYGLNIALFLIVSILEIVYVILMGGNAIWFCLPDKVGWIWTIINFILFGCVVANQISCLMETLSDIAAYNADSGWIDIRWGVFSLIGGVIGSIVCAIIFPPWHIVSRACFYHLSNNSDNFAIQKNCSVWRLGKRILIPYCVCNRIISNFTDFNPFHCLADNCISCTFHPLFSEQIQ